MFNKIEIINHIIIKFATVVPNTCMIMCPKCGKKMITAAEVTVTSRMDPRSVLNLRRLWFIMKAYSAL